MIADRLRKAVLQAAMEGKLTKQLDSDSKVNKLIDKKHFLKGSIGIPWEIPNNWIWTTLDDVTIKISSGGTPSRSNPYYWQNGTIPWLKIKDIKSKYINKSEEFITELGLINSSAKIFPKGTILYTIFATVGDCGILNFDSATNQAIAGIILIDDLINNEYAYYVLLASKNRMLLNARGMAQLNINQQILKNLEIPLPPIEEQKRIVEKLEILLAEIDKLEQDEEALKDLEDKFPEKLKKSILDFAFKGKLTDQLPGEYSSYLDTNLNIGNSKEESHIDIPKNWNLAEFKSVFQSIPTKKHQILTTQILKEGMFPVISQSKNYIDGFYNDSSKLLEISRPILLFGDHTRVVKYIVHSFVVGADGTKILKTNHISEKFGYYYLLHLVNKMDVRNYGRHYKLLSHNNVVIPPIEEQKRIVDKLDELFKIDLLNI